MALTILQAREQMSLVKPTFDDMNLNKLSFAREMEFAIQKFEENPFLLTTTGIDKVLKNAVLSGLSLNPVLKFAYLVPRKIKGQFVCCLDPSYMGLCKILTDAGSVVGISATIVYELEVSSLKIQQGMGGHASHDPYMGFKQPGKPIACYSVAILPNGMKHVELLRPWEWESIRLRSESVKSFNAKKAKGEYAAVPTWDTDPEEMIRKTCIKKHYKYLPKTERAEMAAMAIDLDHVANGIDFEKEQEEKAKEHAKSATTPEATPNAPTPEALATDEDFAKIFELLSNVAFANVVCLHYLPKVKVQALFDGMAEKKEKGIPKSKAEEYIELLNHEIIWWTENPAQPKQEGAE